MSNILDLKQIERKAFRSTHQDGLLDIYLGGIVVALAITLYRPAGGYTPNNILVMLLIYAVIGGLFWAGKKFITVPRLGQVRFGDVRKQRAKTLAIILAVLVSLQALVVLITSVGWFNPEFGAKVFGSISNVNMERLVVAAVAAFFVGPSLLIIAYFRDFPRGYYIAIMAALAVFLMVWVNKPIYPIIIGGLVILPGLVLFIQFLRKYPLPPRDVSNE